jgi:hypothetical protein
LKPALRNFFFEITGNFYIYSSPLLDINETDNLFVAKENLKTTEGTEPFELVRCDFCLDKTIAKETAKKYLLMKKAKKKLRIEGMGELKLAGDDLYGGKIMSSEIDIDVFHNQIFYDVEVAYGS